MSLDLVISTREFFWIIGLEFYLGTRSILVLYVGCLYWVLESRGCILSWVGVKLSQIRILGSGPSWVIWAFDFLPNICSQVFHQVFEVMGFVASHRRIPSPNRATITHANLSVKSNTFMSTFIGSKSSRLDRVLLLDIFLVLQFKPQF